MSDPRRPEDPSLAPAPSEPAGARDEPARQRTANGADPDELAFGPSGYLPERASKRARKIVLRSPLGAQWIMASLVAGLVVLIAGVLLLSRGDAPPPDPWVPVGPVGAVGDASHHGDLDALLVAAGGRVRAFADATGVSYCPQSRRLEADDGRVWSLTGRGFDDAASLDEHPTRIHENTVYVDPTERRPGPSPTSDAAEPAC
jgi:hypothetical protein